MMVRYPATRARLMGAWYMVVLCLAVTTVTGGSQAEAQSLLLSPHEAYLSTGDQIEMTVTLSEPAPPGGVAVYLALDPGMFGTVPALVYVPQGEHSGAFMFQAHPVEGDEVVHALEPSYGSDDAQVHILAALDVVNPREGSAMSLHLLPPRPNPFAYHTALGFDLSVTTPVEVCVYDLSGRLVRRVADAVLPRGRHAVSWDGLDAAGSGVASGIYLYRVTAGSSMRTGRVVLLR